MYFLSIFAPSLQIKYFFPFTDSNEHPDYISASDSESSCSETYPFLRPKLEHPRSIQMKSASKSQQEVEADIPSQSSPKSKSSNDLESDDPHSTQVESASKSQQEFDANIPSQSGPKPKSPKGEEM